MQKKKQNVSYDAFASKFDYLIVAKIHKKRYNVYFTYVF